MQLYTKRTKENREKLLNLWCAWRNWKSLSDVPRSGLIFCGADRKHFKNRLIDLCVGVLVAFLKWALIKLGVTRDESVNEHNYGTIVLLDLMARFGLLPNGVFYVAKIAMPYHEGEEVLTRRDEVDDGRQDKTRKARDTTDGLDYAFGKTPRTGLTKELILLADRMKGISLEEIPHTSLYEVSAWWVKGVDKAEAVLQNVRRREQGVPGRIGYKKDPSPEDMRAVQELGTDDITFVWAWNSARYLEGTVLWDLILVAIHDIYPPEEIPKQFFMIK